jgi:hypothetical protein
VPRSLLTATIPPRALNATGAGRPAAASNSGVPTWTGAEDWWKPAGLRSVIVPVASPVASRPARGAKASVLTRPEPCAASGAPVCSWVAKDHSSVPPPLPAVASVVPFALKDRAATAVPVAMVAPDWPCVAVSQSRTSPSSPPTARTFPPGLNASALTAAGPAAVGAAVIVVPTSC